MDPFTQRMRDRALLRREKLDLQLKNVDTSPTKRIPLKAQEQNQTHLVKITTEVEVTISKPRVDAPLPSKKAESSPPPPSDESFEGDENMEQMSEEEDEQMSVDESTSMEELTSKGGDAKRNAVRSKLQRLGELYSDPSKLSSPIHRTEDRFHCDETSGRSAARSAPARSARLAALAHTINEWEDDLSRPAAAVQHDTGDDDVMRHDMNQHDAAQDKAKPSLVDKSLMDTLESQGYSRSKSATRLVYDYSSGSPQGTPPGSRPPTSAVKEAWLQSSGIHSGSKPNSSWLHKASHSSSNLSSKPASNFSPSKSTSNLASSFLPSKSTSNMASSFLPSKSTSSFLASNSSSSFLPSSPEKRAASPTKQPQTVSSPRPTAGSPEKTLTSASQMGLKAVSPRKALDTGCSPAAAGSVLHKAQLFEAAVSPSKRVDPSDLTLAQRMALFERHKGEALVPQCAFGLSVHPVPRVFAGGVKQQQEVKVMPKTQPEVKATPKTQPEVKATPKTQPEVKVMTKTQQQPRQVVEKPRPVVPRGAVEAEPTNLVSAQRQMFECGGGSVAHQAIAEAVQAERQREMEMLLNRWNQHKEGGADQEMQQAVESPKKAAESQKKAVESPKKAVESQKKAVAVSCPEPLVSTPPPPPPPMPASHTPLPSPPKSSHPRSASPPKSSHPRSASPHKAYPALGEVKRIRVSPPKPGHIYPCLSDIEAATETEGEGEMGGESTEEYNNSSSDLESSGGDTSFGRSILQAVSRHATPAAAGMSAAESQVMGDMDHFLEDAMNDRSSSDESEGPTPPKKTRARSPKKTDPNSSPASAPSHSFKYSRGGDLSSPAGQSQPSLPSHLVGVGGEEVPLMHTVSFYRRQQNAGPKTPVRQVTRQPDTLERPQLPTDRDSVGRKIAALLDEVSKQQTVISQASQALNLCSSTVEFSGSAESVEGERLLLLATHRRQAALNEVQRLKVEGSLKPLTEYGEAVELTEKGALTVRDVALPLKMEYVRNIAADENVHHFLCLVKSQEQVLATQVMSASRDILRDGPSLRFNTALKLVDLYSDFKVLLEVYALQTRKEMLPHEVKYHINKRDAKGRLTPKKKAESRLMMPAFQSPAGPGAVRSPSFQLAGYVVFSLKELQRTHFTLNKVAHTSPLEGQVKLCLDSQLSSDTTERGFLTMFEDVSGFGAWHRRWCVMRGATLSYWKYPDDEKKKVPMGCIDLSTCSTRTVDLVSRDICARPNTFLLEATRHAQSGDSDSLVMQREGAHTTIRHLLSADTREERLAWCSQLNKALTLLRAWGSKKPAQ